MPVPPDPATGKANRAVTKVAIGRPGFETSNAGIRKCDNGFHMQVFCDLGISIEMGLSILELGIKPMTNLQTIGVAFVCFALPSALIVAANLDKFYEVDMDGTNLIYFQCTG